MFTIEAVDDCGALMWTGKGGTKAVLLFPTLDAAESFVDSQCSLIALRVVELTPETIEPWIAKVRRYGATGAILNPSPDGSFKETAKLDAVLRTVLGNCESN